MAVVSCSRNSPSAITSDSQRISGQIVPIGEPAPTVPSIPATTVLTLRKLTVVNESTSSNAPRSSPTAAAQMPFITQSMALPRASLSWAPMTLVLTAHLPVADLVGFGAARPGQRRGRGRGTGADLPLPTDPTRPAGPVQGLAVPGAAGEHAAARADVELAQRARHDVAAAVGAAFDQSAGGRPVEGQVGDR